MKKIFIMLLMVAALASCEKDNSKPKMYDGPLCINGSAPTLKATGYDPYNPLYGRYQSKEVVKRAAFIQVEKVDGSGLITIDVTDRFKDTVNVKLMIPIEYVVTPDLVITDFCYCKNLLILDSKKDTMAYLRNSDYKLFLGFMKQRMAEKDFSTINVLFESTMYFEPSNGRQYRDMKMYGDDKY